LSAKVGGRTTKDFKKAGFNVSRYQVYRAHNRDKNGDYSVKKAVTTNKPGSVVYLLY
jgi:hypothetical protein